MEAVSPADMPAKITTVVLDQTEGFIHAYLAAKKRPPRLADANSVSAIPGRQTSRHITSAAAKYEFVASRTSRVFHRPGCTWVKRIKPANLVGYNSREQAIAAGKRPCKRCKP